MHPAAPAANHTLSCSCGNIRVSSQSAFPVALPPHEIPPPLANTLQSDSTAIAVTRVEIGPGKAKLDIRYGSLAGNSALDGEPSAETVGVWSSVTCWICRGETTGQTRFYWKDRSFFSLSEPDASFDMFVSNPVADKVFESDSTYSAAFGVCIASVSPDLIALADEEYFSSNMEDDSSSPFSSLLSSFTALQRRRTEERIAKFQEEELSKLERSLTAAKLAKYALEERLRTVQTARLASPTRVVKFPEEPPIVRVSSLPHTPILREPISTAPRRVSSALSTSLSNTSSFLMGRSSPKPSHPRQEGQSSAAKLPPATRVLSDLDAPDSSSTQGNEAVGSDQALQPSSSSGTAAISEPEAGGVQLKLTNSDDVAPSQEIGSASSPGHALKARVHFHNEIKDSSDRKKKGKERERERAASSGVDQNAIFDLEGFEPVKSEPLPEVPDVEVEEDVEVEDTPDDGAIFVARTSQSSTLHPPTAVVLSTSLPVSIPVMSRTSSPTGSSSNIGVAVSHPRLDQTAEAGGDDFVAPYILIQRTRTGESAEFERPVAASVRRVGVWVE
ncbi:hypothetical protein M427DRAFT_56063 [Gonapodya prolifera JEL478]|uniref:Uncharacterized protein n=1 Tax=Gonapodya prolifera (strain JEL478) TaxID=1344416 RepID=A0A139AHL4_GONPJ|nr:hypothetical protein M427DRAFT_56063 [Gonapodya prolifera JEL478]|eukprot:KXS16179.1 hypothetical protein M427DRAFT_56063 [Gonapodya prolifera JEL478]